MGRLPGKWQKCRQTLRSYVAFVVLIFAFACISFLAVCRTWFHEIKRGFKEKVSPKAENTLAATSNEISLCPQDQVPSGTMNWQRIRQSLESYASFAALSSITAFLCSLFAINDLINSIGGPAWNITVKQGNSSPSSSTQRNPPALESLFLRVGENLAVDQHVDHSGNLRKYVPTKKQHQSISYVLGSQMSHDLSSPQKRKVNELDTNNGLAFENISSLAANKRHLTTSRSKKIRSSNEAPVESSPEGLSPIDYKENSNKCSSTDICQEVNPQEGSTRMNVSNSNLRKSDNESGQESLYAHISSTFPRINLGAAPSKQPDSATDENPQRQNIPTIPETPAGNLRGVKSTDFPFDKSITLQNLSFKNPEIPNDYKQSVLTQDKSQEEMVSSLYPQFPKAGVNKRPNSVTEQSHLGHILHDCDTSGTCASLSPKREKFKVQGSPSKTVSLFGVKSKELTPEIPFSKNISTSGMSQFSGFNINDLPLKKLMHESQSIMSQNSPSDFSTKPAGSEENNELPKKSLNEGIKTQAFPKSPRSSSSDIPLDRSGEETVSKGSSQLFRADVNQCLIERSTGVSLQEITGLWVSSASISWSHIFSTLRDLSQDRSYLRSPRKLGSPYAFSKTQIPLLPSQNESKMFRGSPYPFSKYNLRASEESPERSRYENTPPIRSPYTISKSCVRLTPCKQSPVMPPRENFRIQKSTKSLEINAESSSNELSPEESRLENIRTPGPSSRYWGTDILQQVDKESTDEFKGDNTLHQGSPIKNSGTRDRFNTEQIFRQKSQYGNKLMRYSPYDYKDQSEETSELSINENKDHQSSEMAGINSIKELRDQFPEIYKDRQHVVSNELTEDRITKSEILECSRSLPLAKETKNNTENLPNSPVEINANISTEGKTEEKTSKNHAEESNTLDTFSKNCEGNSPPEIAVKHTMSSGSIEEYHVDEASTKTVSDDKSYSKKVSGGMLPISFLHQVSVSEISHEEQVMGEIFKECKIHKTSISDTSNCECRGKSKVESFSEDDEDTKEEGETSASCASEKFV